MTETAAMAPAKMIEMRGVTVTSMKSPGTSVAEGVNWIVNAGEFWVVAGPQHSGKTDFLMTAGGIMSPASGDYAFLGESMPIFEDSRLSHRLKMGFVFDGGQLLGHLTVTENVALPLQYHRNLPTAEIEARVRELLEATGLTDWAHATPANLGQSWRQRVGLARALALQPDLLFLDSPLNGLDLRHTAWWLRFLDTLSRGHRIAGGKPLTLVVTADALRPWRKHAGRVACLAGGRLTVLGDWSATEASCDETVKELLNE